MEGRKFYLRSQDLVPDWLAPMPPTGDNRTLARDFEYWESELLASYLTDSYLSP